MTHEETARLVFFRNTARKRMRKAYKAGRTAEGDRWKAGLLRTSQDIKRVAKTRKAE